MQHLHLHVAGGSAVWPFSRKPVPPPRDPLRESLDATLADLRKVALDLQRTRDEVRERLERHNKESR